MAVHAGRALFEQGIGDRRGNAQRGVLVWVYDRGTTTLSTLYTDRTKANEADNPISTNGLGNLAIFADPGDYEAHVDSTGAVLYFTVLPDWEDVDAKAADASVLHRTGGVSETVDGEKDALDNWHFTVKPWADPQSSRYGAIGDGTLHTLAERYGSLGAAQAKYPFATAMTNSIDRCGIQLAMNANPEMVRMDEAAFVFADGEGLAVPGYLQCEGRAPFSTTFSVSGAYAFAALVPGIHGVHLGGISVRVRPGAMTGGLLKVRSGGGHGQWLVSGVHVDGNARRFLDASVDGTTTLTTETPFFEVADVDRSIFGNYIEPGTTIAAYVSPTQVTLSQAATGTATIGGLVEESPDPLIWVDGFITSAIENVTTQSAAEGIRVAGETFASNASQIRNHRAVLCTQAGLWVSGNEIAIDVANHEANYGPSIHLKNAASSLVTRAWFEGNIGDHLVVEDSISAAWEHCRFNGNVAGAPATRSHVKVIATAPYQCSNVRGLHSTYNDGTPSGYDVTISAECRSTEVRGGDPKVLDSGIDSFGSWLDLAGNRSQRLPVAPIHSRTEFRAASADDDSPDAASAHVVISSPSGEDYVAFHPTGHMEIRTASGDPGPDLLQVYSATYYIDPDDGGLWARIRNISGEHIVRIDAIAGENRWTQPQHFAENVIVEYGKNLYFKTTPGAGNVGFAFLATPTTLVLKEESSGTVIFKVDSGGVRFGDTGTTAGRRTLGAAAVDPASTQTLANNIRQTLIDLGLGQT